MEEQFIPDAAVKPAAWDEEEDGPFVPRLIENPLYKGPWSPARKDNPEFRGEWRLGAC